jgi:hypothetical protein
MAGKAVDLSDKQFHFELRGGPQAAKIQFSRSGGELSARSEGL